jgi:hypothetical protein
MHRISSVWDAVQSCWKKTDSLTSSQVMKKWCQMCNTIMWTHNSEKRWAMIIVVTTAHHTPTAMSCKALCELAWETIIVRIYISIKLQPSYHYTEWVCDLLLHHTLHKVSQNSVLLYNTYRKAGKPQLSYTDINAAVLLHFFPMMRTFPFTVQLSFGRSPN